MIIMDDVIGNGGRFLNAHTPYSVDTARSSLGTASALTTNLGGASTT